MNIQEYHAKALLAQYGVTVSKGVAVQSENEFDQALSQFPDDDIIVVKSQILAGGRGKGVFKDGFQGGVKLTRSKREAKEVAAKMLGNTLVTPQTGPAGRKVRTLYFTHAENIAHEYYLAILMDREAAKPVIIASPEGGVDIEEVAADSPEKITKVHVEPTRGLQPYQARQIAFGLGFSGSAFAGMLKCLEGLYQVFWDKDASLVEINPLVLTREGTVVALDAKMGFDDNALFRHPEIAALRDLNEEDEKEVEASKHNLSYISLDGNIACLVNGAGLAMSTMDIIKYFGGEPANFLDVGGGADTEQVTAAFKIILSDPKVKGILVNIFGGIMKCDTIARGIIAAARSVEITVPLVVRLEGTHVELGQELLARSGLSLVPADSLADAAEKIVNLVREVPS